MTSTGSPFDKLTLRQAQDEIKKVEELFYNQ